MKFKTKLIQAKLGLLIIATFSLFTSFKIHNQSVVVDFSLKNVDGNMVSLSDYKSAKGFIIIFTCNHCPFAKLYPKRLNALNKKYNKLGVPLLAISSTDTLIFEEDTFDKMVKKSRSEKFNFPYLIDVNQMVAKNFKAEKTPHAFVIWKDNGAWVIKYNGAIDDNGAEPSKVKEKYVEKAVDAILQGKEVPVKETKSVGCQIHFRG
jgi:peroxiredoxin